MPKHYNAMPISSMKGFTPAKQQLPPTDTRGMLPCYLSGEGIYRSTTVFIRPESLLVKLEKYAVLNQTLNPMGILSPDQRTIVTNFTARRQIALSMGLPFLSVPMYVARQVHGNEQPVICLNTGRFYHTVGAAAVDTSLSTQLLFLVLSGRQAQSKGRRLRYATADEIARYDADPASWQHTEALLPLISRSGKILTFN